MIESDPLAPPELAPEAGLLRAWWTIVQFLRDLFDSRSQEPEKTTRAGSLSVRISRLGSRLV